MKMYPFAALSWVNKDENMSRNKFSQPIGQYIFHSYWNQVYFLKLLFLMSNQDLFIWIQQLKSMR